MKALVNPTVGILPSQERLGSEMRSPLRINTDTDQNTGQTQATPIVPLTVVSSSDQVEVSISRIDAKDLHHVEKGFGILDKNDVYVKLKLDPNGKELKTETRDDAGAKACFDYVNDKNDQKLAETMKWVTTVGELATSKLSWSVWDWNDPNAKDKRPDICIGSSAEVALVLKQIRDGGTEMSETISLDHQTLDGNDKKKAAGKVTIVLNVRVVKETQTTVYSVPSAPVTGESEKTRSFFEGSGKQQATEEEAKIANSELRIRVESLQQQLSSLQVMIHPANIPCQHILLIYHIDTSD